MHFLWKERNVKIAVDLDDVTFEFTQCVLKAWNRDQSMWGAAGIEYDSLTSWGRLFELVPLSWLRRNVHIWSRCKPVIGASRVIRELRQQGHFLEAVTEKPDWAITTVAQLLRNFPGIAFDKVTIVGPGQSKADASDALLLIDDGPDNIRDWAADGRLTLVYDRPWNRDLSGYRRVKSWDDILAYVGSITTYCASISKPTITPRQAVVPPPAHRSVLLKEAERLVLGDRDESYGHPMENFSAMADLYNVLFRRLLAPGQRFGPADIAAAMVAHKLSRRAHGSDRADNWVDIAGYASCGYEVAVETGTFPPLA